MLRELSPGVPVTTNFMVMRKVREMDYFAWAPEVDLVSNDHYVTAADPEGAPRAGVQRRPGAGRCRWPALVADGAVDHRR